MANTYKALSTVTVGAGGAASITFSNIPQTYTDLIIQVSGRDTRSNLTDDFALLINGSSTTYTYQAIVGTGSTASGNTNTFSVGGIWNGNTSTASVFGNATLLIPNYASSNPKMISSDSVMENNATFSEQWINALFWNTSAPVTSLTIQGNGAGSTVLQHSTATLYGVFNADVSSAPATPTIGTATAGDALASITFTGVSNAASYTMTSTPSSITGTGTTSPITVSGLTNGTAYTFKVKSNNPFGSSAESAASNSVTPVQLPAFDSISTLTLGSSASPIDITSIPSTYTHLQLRGFYTFTGNGGTPRMRLGTGGTVNTGAVYSYLETYGSGNTFSGWQGDASAGQTEMYLGLGGEQTTRNSFVINFYDYANTNKNKTISWIIGIGSSQIHTGQGSMNTTAALTNIQFFTQVNPFAAGSTFALYGIKG